MTATSFDHEQLTILLEELQAGPLWELDVLEQQIFRLRCRQQLPNLLRPLGLLYGDRPDFNRLVRRLLTQAAHRFAARPPELRLQDLVRVNEPDWFQKADMIGYVCYADRFAGDLRGVAEKIPYLQELGITYLHLMPLLRPRSGPNDGGYAVVDYRQVNPALGTMTDLAYLAGRLRQVGISLCVDLVCNHTAREHPWARQALAGDPVYQGYYHMFPDRTLPDQYEATTPEVFPEWSPGNFTYYPGIERWVWTTFNEFQWDLNYGNPAVFLEMIDVIYFLANRGVDILRLDAVAFMWKRLGTTSQNQPEAHAILQAWRALSRIVAPGLLLLAEAIVSPDDLVPYLGQGEATNQECELAYHNVLMVMLWSSLAERKVALMTRTLMDMPEIPEGSAWLTYVRCHDDIGWAVTDEDAAAVGLSGFAHRAFLSDFYSGRFPGSFARGVTFQHNPKTNDRRISGAGASLAGIEEALASGDALRLEYALRRLRLIHGVMLAFGGIPVLYMGDEIGLLNDYDFDRDPDRANDNRWIHRPVMDWARAAERHEPGTFTGRIFHYLQHLIRVRKRLAPFHGRAGNFPVWTHNIHVFGLLRRSPRGRILVLGNFSEGPQSVPAARLAELGFSGRLFDHVSGLTVPTEPDLALPAYDLLWLEKAG